MTKLLPDCETESRKGYRLAIADEEGLASPRSKGLAIFGTDLGGCCKTIFEEAEIQQILYSEDVCIGDVGDIGEVVEVRAAASDEGRLPSGDTSMDCGNDLQVSGAEDHTRPEGACAEGVTVSGEYKTLGYGLGICEHGGHKGRTCADSMERCHLPLTAVYLPEGKVSDILR